MRLLQRINLRRKVQKEFSDSQNLDEDYYPELIKDSSMQKEVVLIKKLADDCQSS